MQLDKGGTTGMTWFKVDDSFHSHPKVMATDPAALGLWVIAGSWCGSNLTDGFVPDHVLPRLLPGSTKLAKKLIAAGLWVRTERGYQFHDWHSFNPTAQQVKTDREAAAERQRRFRASKNGSRDAVSHAVTNAVTDDARNASVTVPRPDPTRPAFLAGQVGGKSHESIAPAREKPPPRSRCRQHQHLPDDDPGPNCKSCQQVRLTAEQREQGTKTDELAAMRAWRATVETCPDCDDNGWAETNHGLTQHHPRPGQTHHIRSVS